MELELRLIQEGLEERGVDYQGELLREGLWKQHLAWGQLRVSLCVCHVQGAELE